MVDQGDEQVAQAARAMALLMSAESAIARMIELGDQVQASHKLACDAVDLLCEHVREAYSVEECDRIVRLSAELFRKNLHARIKGHIQHPQ